MSSGITCPHCKKRISGYNPQYDRRMLELGCCVDCGADKTDDEIERGTWRCRKCRERRAIHIARKRGTLAGTEAMHGRIDALGLQRQLKARK